jgi:hypothetical protein
MRLAVAFLQQSKLKQGGKIIIFCSNKKLCIFMRHHRHFPSCGSRCAFYVLFIRGLITLEHIVLEVLLQDLNCIDISCWHLTQINEVMERSSNCCIEHLKRSCFSESEAPILEEWLVVECLWEIEEWWCVIKALWVFIAKWWTLTNWSSFEIDYETFLDEPFKSPSKDNLTCWFGDSNDRFDIYNIFMIKFP